MKGPVLIMMTTCLPALTAVALAVTGLPDPTRPADYSIVSEVVEVQETPERKPDWQLTAIKISGNDRRAIVNGKLVKEGDSIDSARVSAINPVSVVLDHDNKRLLVRLFSDVVSKKKAGVVETDQR